MSTLTLAALARARGLSLDTLHKLGWQERTDGIVIPWPLVGGGVALHIRHTLEKAEGQRRWSWAHFDRSRLLPYGADRLPRMRARSPETLVVTESEVDAVCLWAAGLPALATGGADMWQARWWALAQGFGTVVLWVEDAGTLALLRKMVETRPADAPPLRVCHTLGREAKDAGRILASLNGTGKDVLRRIVAAAAPVTRVVQSEDELLAVVVERLSARRSGAGYEAHCPFHDDRSPSLSIFRGEDGWAFRCHGGSCGTKGSLGLLAATQGIVPPGRGDGPDSPPTPPIYTAGGAGGAGGASAAFALAPLGQLLAEPEEQAAWLVDGLLPAGGVSLLAAKPKVGKSTLARNMALAVTRGVPFLGRATTRGAVVYLALEEKRAEVARHFRRLGATPEDPVFVHVGAAPEEALAALQTAVADHRPALVIIDPLLRLVRVRDANDYAEVTRALEPLLTLARESGAHLVLVHHLGKGERQGGDAILGSTALFGAVDTAILLRRHQDSARTLESIQRYGEDMPESVLVLDEERGAVRLAGTVQERKQEEAKQTIRDALAQVAEAMTEPEIREATGLQATLLALALRALVAEGSVVRSGAGRRGDPYRYALPTRTSAGGSPVAAGNSPPAPPIYTAGGAGGAGGEYLFESGVAPAGTGTLDGAPLPPSPVVARNAPPAPPEIGVGGAGGAGGEYLFETDGSAEVPTAGGGHLAAEAERISLERLGERPLPRASGGSGVGSGEAPSGAGAGAGAGAGTVVQPNGSCPRCGFRLVNRTCWKCRDSICDVCGRWTGSGLRIRCVSCALKAERAEREER